MRLVQAIVYHLPGTHEVTGMSTQCDPNVRVARGQTQHECRNAHFVTNRPKRKVRALNKVAFKSLESNSGNLHYHDTHSLQTHSLQR